MVDDPLYTIKHRINAGDREGARQELLNLLEADADNVDGWALLAVLLTEPAEQAECYRQILRIEPGNSLAAAWLDALARAAPPSSGRDEQTAQEDTDLRCEECGGFTKVRIVGALQERRAVCPSCGAERDLPDTFRPDERMSEHEELLVGRSRAIESTPIEAGSEEALEEWVPPAADELETPLQELNLSALDEETLKQLDGRDLDGLSGEQPEVSPSVSGGKRSFLDRILGRRRGKVPTSGVTGDLDDQLDVLARTGRLGPGDIIRLAGGPLSPEERRKCPGCGSVVSRREARCPWCSAPLPHVGEE